jgi:hypothetical protein
MPWLKPVTVMVVFGLLGLVRLGLIRGLVVLAILRRRLRRLLRRRSLVVGRACIGSGTISLGTRINRRRLNAGGKAETGRQRQGQYITFHYHRLPLPRVCTLVM